jgi:hypothetical protein
VPGTQSSWLQHTMPSSAHGGRARSHATSCSKLHLLTWPACLSCVCIALPPRFRSTCGRPACWWLGMGAMRSRCTSSPWCRWVGWHAVVVVGAGGCAGVVVLVGCTVWRCVGHTVSLGAVLNALMRLVVRDSQAQAAADRTPLLTAACSGWAERTMATGSPTRSSLTTSTGRRSA